MRAGQLAAFPPSAQPPARSGLRAAAPASTSASLGAPPLRPLSALPAQPEQPAAELPDGQALQSQVPQAVGRTGGASVGRWAESLLPPPAQDAAPSFYTWHFLPVLLRGAPSCAGRGPVSPA